MAGNSHQGILSQIHVRKIFFPTRLFFISSDPPEFSYFTLYTFSEYFSTLNFMNSNDSRKNWYLKLPISLSPYFFHHFCLLFLDDSTMLQWASNNGKSLHIKVTWNFLKHAQVADLPNKEYFNVCVNIIN